MHKHSYTTTRGGVRRSYDVEDLWRRAADLPVKEMVPWDLPEFDHLMNQQASSVWWSRAKGTRGQLTMGEFADHVRRILDSDLSYPILLNPEGGVMDGCHRILKAWVLGERVLVQQFTEWP